MPPVKRRKRVIATDDEDDVRYGRHTPIKQNSLKTYLSPPNATKQQFDLENDDAARQPTSPTTTRQSNYSRISRATSSRVASTATTATTRSRLAITSDFKGSNQSPSNRRKPTDEGNGNIRYFFSKQSQKAKSMPDSHFHSKRTEDGALDLTSDPLSDENEVGARRASGISLVGKKAQKRSRDVLESDSIPGSSSVVSGQRFLRPWHRKSTSTHALSAHDIDQRPWSERFGPVNLDELAVHRRKVADVRKWLQDVLSGRLRQRVLILKGSAGTGKTTTMQLLAKDMRFEILEWRNPTGIVSSTMGTETLSFAAQFDDFMGRGRNFGQLEFDGEEASMNPNIAMISSQRAPEDDSQRVILIEEFPDTFILSGRALTSFRRTMLQYLINNTPSLASSGHNMISKPIIPVIMIISETLLATSSASADSFTAHRLLGAEILRHPGTAVIEFNNIAPTLLQKALELIVKKEARVSGRRRSPRPQVLKRLCEIGDIRSAISSLEFLCVKGDEPDNWGSKAAFAKTRNSSKDQALTRGEHQSLELISQREASLGIFHAVGKVVYNKRHGRSYPEGSEQTLAETLPPHLGHMSRPKPSEVAVDTLIDETGTDTSTFISALHENYVLSCDRTGSADTNSSIDYINGCIEYLSESDLLNPSWDLFFRGKGVTRNGSSQGSHILRQDEMAFEVAVRGLLFSLPSPVKRKSTSPSMPNQGGGDSFKMYFPSSIKLWRTKEEIESLIDLWASKLLKGETYACGSKPGIMGGFVGLRGEREHITHSQDTALKDMKGEEAGLLLSLGSSARQEMILERLPYMAHIMRSCRMSSLHSLEQGDVERAVSFYGIGGPVEEEEDDEAEETMPAGDVWTTDIPSEEASPKKRVTAIKARGRSEQSEGSLISSLRINKLVLSDDDIEGN